MSGPWGAGQETKPASRGDPWGGMLGAIAQQPLFICDTTLFPMRSLLLPSGKTGSRGCRRRRGRSRGVTFVGKNGPAIGVGKRSVRCMFSFTADYFPVLVPGPFSARIPSGGGEKNETNRLNMAESCPAQILSNERNTN